MVIKILVVVLVLCVVCAFGAAKKYHDGDDKGTPLD